MVGRNQRSGQRQVDALFFSSFFFLSLSSLPVIMMAFL